ncbi:hypothetical protein L1987_35151 [Smallanthus sonchifolius]|uniref:Uncharacterized protein n=1 Tax=Smallanthus sonchifolius TaxID=185202 RepID=A0ACB9HWA8_9ASTR|nr:hypothetical protein L1987_35151 [Smallanthus sonchifolius]
MKDTGGDQSYNEGNNYVESSGIKTECIDSDMNSGHVTHSKRTNNGTNLVVIKESHTKSLRITPVQRVSYGFFNVLTPICSKINIDYIWPYSGQRIDGSNKVLELTYRLEDEQGARSLEDDVMKMMRSCCRAWKMMRLEFFELEDDAMKAENTASVVWEAIGYIKCLQEQVKVKESLCILTLDMLVRSPIMRIEVNLELSSEFPTNSP